MKEFIQDMDKYLTNGLRKSSHNNMNEPFFKSLINVVVKENGLRPYEDPGALLSTSMELFPSGNFDVDPEGSTSPDEWILAPGVTYKSSSNLISFGTSSDGKIKIVLDYEKGIQDGFTYNITGTISNYVEGGLKFDLHGTESSVYTSTFDFNIVAGSTNNFFSIVWDDPTELDLDDLSIHLATNVNVLGSDMYPFPKLFIGQADTVVVFKQRLYTGTTGYDSALKVDAGIDAFNQLTYEDVWDIDSPSALYDVNVDRYSLFTDFIDMQGAWYLVSTNGITFKTNWASINDDRSGKVLFSPYPKVNAGIYHQGRAVIGGFTSTWNSGWDSLWEAWGEFMPADIILTKESFGKNYILWSGIGQGLLWLMYPEIAVYGPMNDQEKYSITNPYFFEMIRRNNIGWMPLPCRGEIKRIKEFDDLLIVYAEDAIFALKSMIDPAPGYAVKKLANFGIHNSWEVGVGNSEHIFVDMSGRLWKIRRNESGEPTLQFLDYQEFIDDNIDSSSTYNSIVFNPLKDEYYIGGLVTGYALTKSGLSKIKHTLTSPYIPGAAAVQNTSDFKAFYYEHTALTRFEGETEVFDLDLRGIKMLAFVELGVTIDSGKTVEVKVFSRFSKVGGFFDNGWKTVNNEGFVYMGISGVDFKVAIRTGTSSDYQSLKLSNIKVSWKLSDKRNIRGQYAR